MYADNNMNSNNTSNHYSDHSNSKCKKFGVVFLLY